MKVGRIKTKIPRAGRIDARDALVGVRLRLRIEGGRAAKEVLALVNSGYEADTPQLLTPTGLARELTLWPSPP